MTTRYKMKSYELTEDFIKTLKDMFRGKDITITVKEPHDETAYLLSNEANRKVLLERIESVKRGNIKHSITIEEAEAMAK